VTGVDFDKLGPAVTGCLYLIMGGINKEADHATGVLQHFYPDAHGGSLSGYIKAAFGCQFPAFFGYQACHVRLNAAGNINHGLGCGHFKIEPCFHRTLENLDVAVLYMAAVFTKVNNNCVAAGQFGKRGSGNRIRLIDQARLAHSRNVVNINRESMHRNPFLQ
jgi:hypothetical protein